MITEAEARRGAGAALALTVAVTVSSPPAMGQESSGHRIVPTNGVVMSGYGTVGYTYRPQTGENEFSAAVNPLFLFQFQDRILFEAEWEFELEEGVTETGLEYAQVDVIVNNNLTLVGGRFLLPFGVFGERLHPTWINKLPTSPPIYGHHISEFGAEPLIPILTDVGVMARGTFTPGRTLISLNAFVTQGPSVEEEGEQTELIPELAFPASTGDNNTGKMFGGRVDLALPPWAEVNVSYLNGDYDEDNVLDFTAWNLAAEARRSGFEFRGEYIQTRQEVEIEEGFPTFVRHGFYLQGAYRKGAWEPVFRWTQVLDSKLDGEVEALGAWQASFGLDYWVGPSVAVVVGYEVNREKGPEVDNDRFVVHLAYGF